MNDTDFSQVDLNQMYDEAMKWEPPFLNNEFSGVTKANLKKILFGIAHSGQTDNIDLEQNNSVS